jgi:hypothetical protein
LPPKIRRQDKKPDNPVSVPKFAADRIIKTGKPGATVFAENLMPDQEDRDWQHYKTDKYQRKKQRQFFKNSSSQRRLCVDHAISSVA